MPSRQALPLRVKRSVSLLAPRREQAMGQRSPGEPIGCVALLVGAAAMVGVLSTSSAGRRLVSSIAPGGSAPAAGSGNEASAADPRRRTLDAEVDALRAETCRLRDERMS